MRRTGKLISQLKGGYSLITNPVFLADTESPNLRCVRFDKDIVRKDLGWAQFGTIGVPLDGVPMLIDTYYQWAGSSYLIVATENKAYKYVAATDTFTNITASDFTGSRDDTFKSCIFSDLYILTNGYDAIQKWNGSGNMAALGGLATTKARCVASFYQHLILGFTIESGTYCPYRVRWSVIDDGEDWTGSGSGFVDLVDTVDWITALIEIRGHLFVFKERSIWELVHIGGSDVFRAEMRVDGIGTQAGLSPISLGDACMFYGVDNIYIFDGLTCEPVGDQLFPLLYDSESRIVNAGKVQRAPACYIEELSEYWICLPTYGEEPDLLVKYNLPAKNWTRRDVQVTALGYYEEGDNTPWESLTGDWASQTWNWLTRLLPSGAPTTLIATANGYIYEDDRTHSISDELMLYETKDFLLGLSTRIVGVNIQSKNGPANLYYSTDQGDTWVGPYSIEYSSGFEEHKIFFDLTCQYFRIRLQTIEESFDVKWIEPVYIQRKRSL